MSTKKSKPTEQPIREHKKTNPFVFILSSLLLVILIVSFVFTPALLPSQAMGQGLVFGRYGSQEIAYRPGNFFAQQFDYTMQQATSQGYDAYSPFIYYTLWLQAFRSASQYAVLMDHSTQAKIEISQKELTTAVQNSGYFNKNGSFNSNEFNTTAPDRRETILQDIRNGLMISRYQELLTKDVLRSKNAIDILTNPSGPLRRFEIAFFPFDQFPVEKIIQFANENIPLFEQIEVQRILVEGKKQDAEKVYAQLANKEKEFSTVFIEQSREQFANESTPPQQGSLGAVFAYQIQDSLQNIADLEKIMALDSDSYSLPIAYRTDDKKISIYAIYHVTKARTTLDMSQTSARADVLTYLQSKRKGLISDYFLEQASQINAQQFRSTIPPTAEYLSTDYLPMVYKLGTENLPREQAMYYPYNPHIDSFNAGFGDENIALANAAMHSKDFFMQGFSLAANTISDPVVLDSGVVVLKLLDEKPVEIEKGDDSSIDFLINYFLGQYTMSRVSEDALASRRYKNNFNKVYAKKIEPLVNRATQETTEELTEETSSFGPEMPVPSIGLPQSAAE
ncbi:MAG: hypothetical protein ACRCVN_03980 [Spirochaetia bacterium]